MDLENYIEEEEDIVRIELNWIFDETVEIPGLDNNDHMRTLQRTGLKSWLNKWKKKIEHGKLRYF
jgi:hypothetical protein